MIARICSRLTIMLIALFVTLGSPQAQMIEQLKGFASKVADDADELIDQSAETLGKLELPGSSDDNEAPAWRRLYDDATGLVDESLDDLARTFYLLNETDNTELARIRAKIDDIRLVLDEYLELETAERRASSFTIISKSKKDYEIAQHTLLSEIQETVFRDEITDHSTQYYKTVLALRQIRDDISRANEAILLAPEKGGLFEKTKGDFEKQKVTLKSMEVDLMQLIDRLEMDLMIKFKRLGAELTREEVRSLLVRVDGNDIAQSMALFSVSRDITEILSELLNSESTTGTEAVKYYGMYVLLAELMLKITIEHQIKIEDEYQGALAEIRAETKDSISDSQKILKNTTAVESKRIVSENIKNMQLALSVLDTYRVILQQRSEKLEESIEKTREVISVAYSTYDTAASTANLVSFINTTQSEFDNVFSLQLPEMIEFDNANLKSAYATVSLELQERMQ